ncbi:hypothetical protein KAZ57_03120 [Patescibacteria group bacterium]|nr:hypothetical protein [Patescibacteria group bacterium]
MDSSSTKGLITILIVILLIVAAVYTGNYLVKLFFGFAVSDLPFVGKFLVHGLTLGLILFVLKKFFAK